MAQERNRQHYAADYLSVRQRSSDGRPGLWTQGQAGRNVQRGKSPPYVFVARPIEQTSEDSIPASIVRALGEAIVKPMSISWPHATIFRQPGERPQDSEPREALPEDRLDYFLKIVGADLEAQGLGERLTVPVDPKRALVLFGQKLALRLEHPVLEKEQAAFGRLLGTYFRIKTRDIDPRRPYQFHCTVAYVRRSVRQEIGRLNPSDVEVFQPIKAPEAITLGKPVLLFNESARILAANFQPAD